jgi:hypothetical protein
MKKIIYLGIYSFLFSQILGAKAQNLEFNTAVFYTYSGVGDGGFSASQVNVGSVIVGTNQILKIRFSYKNFQRIFKNMIK